MKKLFFICLIILQIKSSELEILKQYSQVAAEFKEPLEETPLFQACNNSKISTTTLRSVLRFLYGYKSNNLDFNLCLQKINNHELIKISNLFNFFNFNKDSRINLSNVLKEVIRRNLQNQLNKDLKNYLEDIADFDQYYEQSFANGASKYEPSIILPRGDNSFTPPEMYKSSISRNNYFFMSVGNKVIIWDLQKEEIIYENSFESRISSIRLSANNKDLAISYGNKIVILDFETKSIIYQYEHKCEIDHIEDYIDEKTIEFKVTELVVEDPWNREMPAIPLNDSCRLNDPRLRPAIPYQRVLRPQKYRLLLDKNQVTSQFITFGSSNDQGHLGIYIPIEENLIKFPSQTIDVQKLGLGDNVEHIILSSNKRNLNVITDATIAIFRLK